MKKLIVLGFVSSLVACSSTTPLIQGGAKDPAYAFSADSPIKDPVQNRVTKNFGQVPEFEAHAMTRMEVISASEQCQNAHMKPFVEYVTQKTDYGRVLTPINVHCTVNH
jgi:hypothetical protein